MKKIYFGGPSITSLEKKNVLDSVTNGFYDGMKKDLMTFETKLKKLLKMIKLNRKKLIILMLV
jgi:hypothetical protein